MIEFSKKMINLDCGVLDREVHTYSDTPVIVLHKLPKLEEKKSSHCRMKGFAHSHLSLTSALSYLAWLSSFWAMSPSNFYGQLLKMASRAIFNPACCFPTASAPLTSRPANPKDSPARTISEYLGIMPIEGKGFGTVARKDVDAYTLLFSESPTATAQGNQLDRPREMAYIEEAYRRLSPGIQAQFDTLHEGSRPFQTREMRIWKANAFAWDRKDNNDGKLTHAIFLDMSRINHSCLPNADYHENWEKKELELYSNTRIRAGEEVTICYGSEFDYKTGAERNAHLKCIYGFTCKCRACTDPVFSVLSDRRRRMLKNDFFCGMLGMPRAPDYSAETIGIETPNSIQPAKTQYLQQGFADGSQIFRPGTVQLMRRTVKLRYDEGLGGDNLRNSIVPRLRPCASCINV